MCLSHTTFINLVSMECNCLRLIVVIAIEYRWKLCSEKFLTDKKNSSNFRMSNVLLRLLGGSSLKLANSQYQLMFHSCKTVRTINLLHMLLGKECRNVIFVQCLGFPNSFSNVRENFERRLYGP